MRVSSSPSARRAARVGLASGLVFSGVLVTGFALLSRAQAPSGAPSGPASRPPLAPVAAQGAAAQPGVAVVPVVMPPTIRITFLTVPPVKKAFVLWGKKRLGLIAPHAPLIIQKPRDSGPLDVIVQSEGYLPVQTRAMTFADNKVSVKLTPVDQKNTLLGYREELPPPPPPAADGGVAPVMPAPGAPAGASPAPGAPPPPSFPAADAGAR
jgi:hypothetical protein